MKMSKFNSLKDNKGSRQLSIDVSNDFFLWHLQHSLCYEQSLQTALTWDPPSRECRKSPGPPPGPDAGTR